MEGFIDYYELLGVSPNASTELIKKAYRIGTKNAHPDTGGSEAEFIVLQIAYETLTDSFKRKEYDEKYKKMEFLKYDNLNKEKQDYAKQFQSTNSDAKESDTINDESPISRNLNRGKPKWRIIASGFVLLLVIAKLFDNIFPVEDYVDTSSYTNVGYISPIGEGEPNENLDDLVDLNHVGNDIETSESFEENQNVDTLVESKVIEENNIMENNSVNHIPQIAEVVNTIPPVLGNENFSIGSTKEEVFAVMGTPTQISSYINQWNYGLSSIDFDDNDMVSGWNNYKDNLHVHVAHSESGFTFTMGSSKTEVLKSMGTPTQISSYINQWNYGLSSIDFDDNDNVSGWNNYKDNLHVHVAHSGSGFTFTIGSSKAEVLKSMGTPTQISSYINQWNYGLSSIDFDDNDMVSGWNNYKDNLHVHVAHSESGFTFTMGSSKAEVLKTMGTPTQISSYINQWNYGLSSIDFDDNDNVSGWNNYKNNLKLK